ncbi:MAG: arabinogalactan endo-1,4-beta-galactosidase [Fibromonadales bacterium]|nr:arabinogalactan endo-1,4-beta-galactosidase [Fibromonadales bacterium]
MNRIVLSVLLGFAACAFAQNEPFALGADISWIQQRENPAAAGGGNVKYYHDGQAQDMLAILKEHGFNYIRLRLFVDPTAGVPEDTARAKAENSTWYASPYSSRGYCGLDSTIKYAKKVKAAGFKFLLDFHYSDTWADPGKQYKPMSWRGLNSAQVIEKVRSYTKESLEKFKANDVLPDMVQVGNEVVGGMIHPDGNGNNANFAKLVHAGINGVKDVDANIKIMMHSIAQSNRYPNNWLTTLKTNLNAVEANFANKIDVYGLSYYPEWHGDLNTLQSILTSIANTHNIKISVVEYADKHREVNDMVFALPDNKGFGTFVWEPQEFDGDNSLPLFDWKSGTNSGRYSNARLELYPQMAIDYGTKVPSSSSVIPSSSSVTPSSSSAPSSSSSLTPSSSSSGETTVIRIAQLKDIPKNARVEVYNLQGKLIATSYSQLGQIDALKKRVYIVKIF